MKRFNLLLILSILFTFSIVHCDNKDSYVKKLIEQLKSKDVDARHWAALSLNKMGSNAKIAVSQLIETLENDSDSLVRCDAINALAEIAPKNKKVIAAISKGLENQDWKVRLVASECLGKIGLAAEKAIPNLEKALTDEDVSVRIWANFALIKINPKHMKHKIVVLARFLNNRNPRARYHAAEALGEIGPSAKIAIPFLNKMSEVNRRDYVWATYTLIKIKPGYASIGMSLLLEHLDDDDELVCFFAAYTLSKIGSHVIPKLVEKLGSEKAHVREYAAYALGQMKTTARLAIPHLEKLLNDNSESVRKAVKIAIREIR